MVYVLNADDSGAIKTAIPGTPGGPELQRNIDWVLLDGMTVSSIGRVGETAGSVGGASTR